MTVLIVHYHLRCGGVTRVIESQVRALEEKGHKVIVASSGPKVDWCDHQLIVPELDYCNDSPLSGKTLRELIPESPGLWLIHNPTLAKNALFPELIECLAEERTHVLLQCHDFAEDGRPANYQRLSLVENLYPLAPNIHYAFVNTRDQSSLIEAGIPESQCHHLPNAIVPPKSDPSPENPVPLIFCPVRGIRRKNLGELCLLAAHAPGNVRFAVAVAPENPEWITIHNQWADLAAELGIPIDFNVVNRLAPALGDSSSFASWLGHATHLITTSIAEGFGLTFLEPALLKKPLIGRDLPEITQDFSEQKLGSLYQSLPIALKHLDLEKLQEDFLNQVGETFHAYGFSIDNELEAAWLKFIESGSVDFGNLPESHQADLIRHHRFPEIETWLAESLQSPPLPIDTYQWSLDRYANTLDGIIDSVTQSESASPTWLPKENVLAQFLLTDRFHFLRT